MRNTRQNYVQRNRFVIKEVENNRVELWPKMENFGSIGRIMAGLTILSVGQIWFGSPNNQVEVEVRNRVRFIH